MNRPVEQERGAALVISLLLVVVLGTVVSLSVDRSRMLAAGSTDEQSRMRARHAADGGLAHARHALANDPEHRGATLEIGSCEVETLVVPAAPVDGRRSWRVTVIARPARTASGTSAYRAEAVLTESTDSSPRVTAWTSTRS